MAVATRSAPALIDPTHSAAPFTHEIVASLLDRPNDLCVIDLGAGPGNFTAYLEGAGYRVVAIDIDEEDYRRAGHATAPFVAANLDEALPELGAEEIGGAVAIEILEHLESPLRLVRAVADVLVDDGWLIVTTPNVSSIASKLELMIRGNELGFNDGDFARNGHISPVTLKQLTRIGSRVGLEIERVTYNVGRIPLPRLRRRLLLRSERARCELLGESLIVKFRKRGGSPFDVQSGMRQGSQTWVLWRRRAPPLPAALTLLRLDTRDGYTNIRNGWPVNMGKAMNDYAVVIPTYDRRRAPEFLVQAVDSALGQTLPVAEVIVVSDGPADAVNKALTGRPVKILEQPPGGVARARNTGVAAAESEWLCFLDDDDLWHPDFLRTTDQFLRANKDAAAVNSSFWTFAVDERFSANLVANDLAGCLSAAEKRPGGSDTSYMEILGRSFDLLLERPRVCLKTAAVRRDIVERVGGFPVEVPNVSDWLFFVNVARFVEWYYIPKRLAFLRRHATRTSSIDANFRVDLLRAIHHMWAEASLPIPTHRQLSAYGGNYRFRVQGALWGALRSRRLDLAQRALNLGMPLLPSWRDRIYALTPPQLTWRIEHGLTPINSRARRYAVAGRE